jgi:hypothetical protein
MTTSHVVPAKAGTQYALSVPILAPRRILDAGLRRHDGRGWGAGVAGEAGSGQMRQTRSEAMSIDTPSNVVPAKAGTQYPLTVPILAPRRILDAGLRRHDGRGWGRGMAGEAGSGQLYDVGGQEMTMTSRVVPAKAGTQYPLSAPILAPRRILDAGLSLSSGRPAAGPGAA